MFKHFLPKYIITKAKVQTRGDMGKLSWYGKNSIFNLKKNYAMPSVDSCPDYDCIKNYQPIAFVKVVMYSVSQKKLSSFKFEYR